VSRFADIGRERKDRQKCPRQSRPLRRLTRGDLRWILQADEVTQ